MQKMHKISTNDVKLGKNLARELRLLRRRAGLRQIDLAIKSRVALRTLQRYERGDHPPDNIALRRLAAALNTTSGAILDAAVSPDLPPAGGRSHDADDYWYDDWRASCRPSLPESAKSGN